MIYCERKALPFLSSCGPIAHNEIWGKSDTNRIDEYLLEFILSDKLEVYNVENMTRFVTSIRQEVLDITQGIFS